MALYFLGSDEIYKNLQQCCEEKVALLSLDTMQSSIAGGGVVFLDGEQDFLTLEDALKIGEATEGISIIVICSEEPPLLFEHILYLPLEKDVVIKLIDELRKSTFGSAVEESGDSKVANSLAKVNDVIDAVFESSSEDEQNFDSMVENEGMAMSDNEKKNDEEIGLEFHIPDSGKTQQAQIDNDLVENENDLEMEISGEIDLSLKSEAEQSDTFFINEDTDSELGLELSESSLSGIVLGSKDDDSFEYNAQEVENVSDIDLENPKKVAPSPIEDEDIDELDYNSSESLFTEDDLGANTDFENNSFSNFESSGSFLSEESENLEADIADLDFSAEAALKDDVDISNEFSEADLLFGDQEEDEELAKTKVVSSAQAHEIDEDDLDKTLNTMLFANNIPNKEELENMASEIGKDLDGVEGLDFSNIEEDVGEKTNSITEVEADFIEENTSPSIPPISFLTEDDTQTEMVAPESYAQLQEVESLTSAPSIAREEIVSVSQYAEDELLRLQGTIRQLREEREEFLQTIDELKGEHKLKEQDKTGLEAELDELKIELSIIKKRHLSEMEEMRYQLRLNEEKKEMFEQRAKNAQKEIDRLSSKIHIDINKVKQREKDLESQLELVTMDSESKVKSRDMKILELKRKIDALEFNMENVAIREHKLKEDKVKTEERLNKIMKTLRGSIKLLEDDIEYAGEEKEHKDRE